MGKHNAIQIGDRRGKLLIVGRDPNGTGKHPRYFVKCDCGSGQRSITGTTLSKARACRKCHTKPNRRKYGDRIVQGDTLYLIWTGMRYRCRSDHPKNKRWYGRGIKVCAEWDVSFEAFEKWALENGYQSGLSLDRVDNDGDYQPSNCEWVTRSTNSKRARALYRFIRVDHRASFYDEACFGDF